MKKLMISLACGLMKFVNLFFRGLKLKDQVVIISRQSDQETMDIRMLREELEQLNIQTKVLCKKINGIGYAFHMLKQMKEINRSKIVVLDSYCILVSVLPKKTGQQVIQMWHALGAIKKFGWQSAGNEDGRSDIVAEGMKMHAGYDYFLAPSAETEKYFREAFRTEGKALRIGLPRIDYLRGVDPLALESIKEEYPIICGKTNVLYVPTFRKNAAVEMEKLIEMFDFQRFNLIIKKHFLDNSDYGFAKDRGAIVDEKFTSLNWFWACDKVITDYSAISLEAALCGKEIFIYQPDVKEYERANGLNIFFETEAIAPYYATDEETLMKALNKDYDKDLLEKFKNKYFEIDLDSVVVQLANFMAELMTNKRR